MVTNDLGACEWFVWDLRRSALIDRGQLDHIVGEFLKRNPRADAPQLAEYLVQQGTLTAFQAERVLNQKTQGLVLGPYVLLDAIGQGSMGQVFKASSKNDTNHYAVKVLPRRSMWNVRLARRQVRSFSQFSHPAVVPFVDVGTAGGLHYLAWPMIEGQTLEALVTQDAKLPPEQTARIGMQIAQGMHVAHQNNIFHGLIKPSNIMIGSDGQARILDFGIGSLLVENEGESLVDTMSTANTLTSGLDCSSPESVMDPTVRTPAGDQYSFGCVLYYCLTGRFPFPEGNAVEKMMAHQTKQPEPIASFCPECPEGLIAVVSRLMAKQPEQRYSGMDEVVEALEPYLGDLAGVDTPEPQASNTMAGSAPKMRGLSNFGAAPKPAASPAPSRFGTTASPVAATTSATPAQPRKSFVSAPQKPQPRAVPEPPAVAAPAASAARMPLPPKPISRMSFGTPAKPVQAPIPTRASRPAPVAALYEEEVALTTAQEGYDADADYNDASKLSAGWIAGLPETKQKPAFGMLGIVAAGLMLATLVFLGVKLLILQ
jgi:serine/threonine-protein kinase